MPNSDRRNATLIAALLVLACGWFLGAYLYKAGHTVLVYDSGWHATVAKNFATGPGYASSYNGYTFFDPDVTTGPVPIALTALAIALFGNQYSLPLYVISLLHLGLAIALVIGVYNMAGRRSGIAFGLFLALVISYYEPRWWYDFTGDMSTMLWGLLGLMLVVRGVNGNRNRVLVAAGLVFGLSLLSKPVGILLLAGAAAYVVFAYHRNRAKAGWALLAIAAGLAICLSPWLYYKATAAVSLDSHNTTGAEVAHSPLERRVVGVTQLWEAPDKWAHVKDSVHLSDVLFNMKLSTYGLPAYSHLAIFLTSLLLLIYAFLNQREQRHQWLLPLALATVAYWIWHLVLCFDLDPKYTLYPLFMSLVLILYWLCTTRMLWLAPYLLIAWVLAGSASAREEALRFYSFDYEEDQYRRELFAVASELSHFDRQAYPQPLAGCGWQTAPWALEYIMPGSNNFIDCYQHLRQAIEQNPQTGAYEWRAGSDLGFILVGDVALWAVDKENAAINAVMQQICAPNTLYRTKYFGIQECRDEDIRAKIVLDADSPLLHLRRPSE